MREMLQDIELCKGLLAITSKSKATQIKPDKGILSNRKALAQQNSTQYNSLQSEKILAKCMATFSSF